MILYFANRQLDIIGQASTGLRDGLTVTEDKMTISVETGAAIFECEIPFDDKTRAQAEACAEVGNYLLRSNDSENEFYTIIESELDTKDQRIYIYAEDAGMDLLNEVVGAYAADKAYPISHYIEKYAAGAGFAIGTNEVASLTRKLSWDGEATAQERLLSVATQFDNCEISFSFEVDGLLVVKKYINIHKERGKELDITLRLNYDVDSIITTKSIANLATALQCTGGTPEDSETPITLAGYKYDDGDFYVDGTVVKSRNALKKWARLLWKTDGGTQQAGGHITKQYNYDTLSQATLCARAITELKKICDVEVNYEADITRLPDNVAVGDRVNIVDDAGELYLSTRLLTIETSVANQTRKAVLGDYILKKSGISQKVVDLAAKFAKTSITAARALAIANNAKTAAETAQTQAETAVTNAENAQTVASAADAKAQAAKESADNAKVAADNAQAVVDSVEKNVAGLEASIANAQAAAEQARQAAATAETKASEAATAAQNAQAEAEQAAESSEEAIGKSEEAITKADSVMTTAEQAKATAEAAATTAAAARQDAEAAQNEIDALGENLTTLEHTMQVDYARKTDLTETEATLQTQITQNAAGVSTVASKLQTIDETANNAAELAIQATEEARQAREEADRATADAKASQAAANEARAAANNAQAEADAAQEAAEMAQAVAGEAAAALAAAQADLETVIARGDATEEEIQEAQAKVDAAQIVVEQAEAEAAAALTTATNAQATAAAATEEAITAEATANEAASLANTAKALADSYDSTAYSAAIAAASLAQLAAAEAQRAAAAAVQKASDAQTTAANAVVTAATAKETAETAGEQLAQAEADLAAAQQRLADVMADVSATEEEVQAAQADVETAQAAALTANQWAIEAQAIADQAEADAQAAEVAATEALEAAEAAQIAATEATEAAQIATDDVKTLGRRMSDAETRIDQNAEEIALRATKTEVTETLGGYYTKEEADANLSVQADEISLSVKSAVESAEAFTTQALTHYTDTADFEAFKTSTESQLELLSDQMTLKFTESQEQLDSTNSNLQNQINDITKYFRFSAEGFEIGQTDGKYKTSIDDDKYSMSEDGVDVMWIEGGKLNIPEVKVTTGLDLLGFRFSKDSAGNVNLEYVGD